MRYYTFYRLEVFDTKMQYLPNTTNEHAALISKKIFGEDGCSAFEDSHKWCDHQDDMIPHSKEYPDLVFCLTGEGEDRDDNWKEWYKNGKLFICQGRLVFDDFDINSIL